MNSPVDIISFDHHVHYYPQFSWQLLLESSWRNLTSAATCRFSKSNHHSAICLLESNESRWFQTLDEQLLSAHEWQLGNPISAMAQPIHHKDGHTLTIVRGRQITTSENLEVLVLGDDSQWPDKPSLDHCVERASEQLIVIPWAVGKWLGARGKKVSDTLRANSHQLSVGDNGGRPRLWSNVEQFKLAQSMGLSLLPGSDPLPLPGAEVRAGSNGVFVEGRLDNETDVQQFLSAVRDNNLAGTYRSPQSLFHFIRDQIKLRLK